MNVHGIYPVIAALLAVTLGLHNAASAPPVQQAERLRIVAFVDETAVERWRVVNDTVMGGESTSSLEATGRGTALFRGVLSLRNRGGFATVRTDLRDIGLKGYDGLLLRIRGDGKRYSVFLKTNRPDDGYRYQVSFDTEAGVWQTLRVPFDDFLPHWRGLRLYLLPSVSPEKVGGIGFTIADKQEGPFELEIDWVDAYRIPSEPEP